jgi:hypothetical protein
MADPGRTTSFFMSPTFGHQSTLEWSYLHSHWENQVQEGELSGDTAVTNLDETGRDQQASTDNPLIEI